jgi:ATP-binding cassette subfamily B protein/ATP-binding cassette subfamily B multidrug efflux pump
VGWLIVPARQLVAERLYADHWAELLGLLFLLVVVRTLIMVASAAIEAK